MQPQMVGKSITEVSGINYRQHERHQKRRGNLDKKRKLCRMTTLILWTQPAGCLYINFTLFSLFLKAYILGR